MRTSAHIQPGARPPAHVPSVFFIVAAHGLPGLYSRQAPVLAAAALPAVSLGDWLSIRVSGRFREYVFRRIFFLMILAMGLNMFRVSVASG